MFDLPCVIWNFAYCKVAVSMRVTRKHWPPVRGPPLRTGSADYLWTGPRTTPTDPLYGPAPQNIIKIRKKYFTHGLSNGSLVSANFRVLHCANVIDTLLPPAPPARKKKPISFIQRKEMPLAKRRKIVTLHSRLNLTMEDEFLGSSSLFLSVTALSKLWSLERVHESTWEWAEQNGGGERAQIPRLPGGFLETFTAFHIQYGHSKGNGNVQWYNLRPSLNPKNVEFAKCKVWNFNRHNLLDNP